MPYLTSLNLQRGAEHLHALGPRVIAEFINQLAREADCQPEALDLLNAYRARITPDMVRHCGADRFAYTGPRVVPMEGTP